MERVTPRLLVPAAALLILAGCGGQPQPTTKTQTTPSPVRTSAAPGTDAPGTLSITQSGTTPANTIWYARVETPNGRSLAEASFTTGPIALDKSLPPGRYRAISWHRACTGTCPTSGENGLGPLAEVCGAAVTVPAGGRVTATVVIGEAGTCTVRP